MTAVPEFWSDPDDVDAKLKRDFGVTSEPFRNALNRARLEWATTTANDPPNLPGMIFWGTTVRYLRDELLPLGWTKADPRNWPLVITPRGTVGISVATGTDETGSKSPLARPTTKAPKGTATIEAVEANAVQFELPFSGTPPAPTAPPVPAEPPLIYILLIRNDRGVLSAELSLPLTMGPDGRPVRWKERIVIPMESENDGGDGLRRGRPEPGPDVDVTITRRVG